MEGNVEILSRLVSRLSVRHAMQRAESNDDLLLNRSSGVTLFFDISEFTPLTTRYASQGPGGLEALSDLINRYFTDLLEPVHRTGGDVLAFFGDAVLILYTEPEGGDVTLDLMSRALSCAAAARDRCHNYPTGEPNHTLGLKTTVGAGEIKVSEVHAMGTARQVIVYGDAVRQIGSLDHLGVPGEILLSPEALAISPTASFDFRSTGNAAVLVNALCEPNPSMFFEPTVQRVSLGVITPYIDRSIAERISTVGLTWLAEFRTITSLFVSVRLGEAKSESPESFQELFGAVAPHIAELGGSIIRFAVEDKGIVFSCGFGMPGKPAENIAAQAVRAGFQAMDSTVALGHQVSVGCATGQQYCGPMCR